MNKKDPSNNKKEKNKTEEVKKMNNTNNSKKKNDKDLPWWVELLFVQIGLSDKLLIYILKTKKKSKKLI